MQALRDRVASMKREIEKMKREEEHVRGEAGAMHWVQGSMRAMGRSAVVPSGGMDWMCCFSSCKPRYARLADSIYPRSLNDGLVTSNMQKLTFYAISHPEKLDRIGTVLVNQLSKDLARQRFTQVKISVDAMDQLLQSCHGSPSLNQFTENFLKMVQKLLETNLPAMEKLATDSFVNFANIQEETPSYHRQYDFFISKFSAMCHVTRGENASQVRYQGLRGLRGVVWKSVTDDLQANIWEKEHMDKIVPSILYNFYDDIDEQDKQPTGRSNDQHDEPFLDELTSANLEQNPRQLADQCLRELMGKASFGSLRSVMEPVLKHCDSHSKWNPPANFAIATFRAILYSIPTQISNFVIQVLINHLDTMSASEAEIRIGIATVLSSIVSIAGTSIGPLLLDIFNSLLKHLRASVEYQQSRACPSVDHERRYQETLINAMADFANALPDYQKVEIMMFTVGNIPKLADDDRAMRSSDSFLQHVLVKTLLKIATKYKTAYLATIFTDSFLNALLDLSLVSDPQVRYTTQRIFHTLFDRHDNLHCLEHLPFIGDVADLQLTVEKCTRADQMFMRRHIAHITYVIYRCVMLIEEDEHLQNNVDAILCTMALLCIEVGYDETLIELFRLVFGLQSMALDNSEGSRCGILKKAAIHNLVARYLNLSCQLLAIPSLCHHVQQVVSNRAQKAHPLVHFNEKGLPKQTTLSEGAPSGLEIDDDLALQFDKSDLSEALKASGKEVQHLAVPFKIPGSLVGNFTGNRFSVTGTLFEVDESNDSKTQNSSTETALDDVSLDLSIDWSPPTSKKTSRRNTIFSPEGHDLMVPTNVSTLRQMVNAPPDFTEEIKKDQEQSQKIVSMFRDDPDAAFDACVKKDLDDDKTGDLSASIQRLIQRNMNSAQMSAVTFKKQPKNVFELKLPDSFVF
ncbi:hypothetical protein QR680_012351 [Steinernema hermaphroditum]|uniref:Uncharacterized protein n=1 Tax=Steinernema hermaphroditum TaxID=289476 RepID=A0AA39I4B2_9BILA|nr:hypothetical protein QR680_012351 [Steinernema hermaphroditum]